MPGAPSKEDIQAAADREREFQRAAGTIAMRNDFAAAALSGMLARGALTEPMETTINNAFKWGQAMAEEAAKRIEKDLEKFQS